MNTTGSARSADGAVKVTVGPGGALRALDMRDDALAMGGRRLADTVLELVRIATVEATSRARNRLRDELAGLPADALAALGLADDPELAEQVESTVPVTWRDV